MLLLQAGQEDLQGLVGLRVLELKKDELKRLGQALIGKSGVGLGDSQSARGWLDYVRGLPRCLSFSHLGLHGQPQRMLK